MKTKELSLEPRFYVYVLLDPRKPGEFEYGKWTFKYEPFYVGKGSGARSTLHVLEANKNILGCNPYKFNKIKKIQSVTGRDPIVLRRKNLDEDTALKLEIRLIQAIGRGKYGPLTNLTDGGDGWSGARHSKRTRRRISEAAKISQPIRFADQKQRDAIADSVRRWNSANPDAVLARNIKRAKTSRSAEARKKAAERTAWNNVYDPQLVKRQQLSRDRTQEEIDYYSQISRTLGGKPVEVNINGNCTIFRSQRQAARHLGCFPSRVNAALHMHCGYFSEEVKLRFVC